MKRKWIVLIALFAVLSVFAACKNGDNGTTEYVYEISGVKNIEITVNDTTYDFLQGVTGKKNGENETVVVNSEGVVFGKAGVYDIVYTCGTKNESAKVYVYTADRKAAITAEDITLTYAEALKADSILTGIVATDKLGKEIKAIATEDYQKTEYGLIKTGEHQIAYTAGEGEEAKTVTRKIVVNAGELPVITEQTTDLKKPEISFNVEGGVFVGLYGKNGEATEDDYTLNNNVLTLVGDYIESLGAGEHELCILFEKGYVIVEVTITDNQSLDYTVENLFDQNNYIVGTEVVFAKGVRGEFSKQNIEFKYRLDGEEITEASMVFEDAGEHKFEVIVTRGETSETHEYAFVVLSATDYYGQNFVNKQNVELWVSGNGDAVTYVDATDTDEGYFVLKHTSDRGGDERCFYIKDLMQNAIAAGMNELYVKLADGGEMFLDAYELESANYYDSPWGGVPWNVVAPMYHGSATELSLVLDDAYAPASATGNLMMFAVKQNEELKVTGISFGKGDHTVAYQGSYEDRNVISASITIKKDVSLENLEFYITDKAASVKGARAGYGLVLCKDSKTWNGWIGINAYSASPVQEFSISKTDNMGPGYPEGNDATINGKIGCCSPLEPNIFSDREGYYNADGSKTFTVKFIPEYDTNNTKIEFYFGTKKFFTVIPTKAEEMRQIITSGKVVILVNGKSAAADCIEKYNVLTDKENFYTYEGIDDVELSVADAGYDFESGVKVKCNGEEVDFVCNADAVQYGKVGEYDVTYTSNDGEFTKKIKVIIRAFEASESTSLTIMGRKTALGTVTKVYVQEGTDYTVTYKLNGEEVDIETLKDGDNYVKVFDQPGKYIWSISVQIGDLEAVTTEQTINVVTSTERLNKTSKVNDINKVTIEFTVNDSTSLDSLEVYIGQKMKTVANARKLSVGLRFNIKDNNEVERNRVVMEGYDKNGNQGNLDFRFQRGVDNMGGTTDKESSSSQVIWASSLLSHGAYYEYYGGESMTKRNMKFVFTKLDTGYAQIEYYLGNAETGEYTKMFAVWTDETCTGAEQDRPRFKWPAAKGDIYANIIVNGSMDANAHISNYKITTEIA